MKLLQGFILAAVVLDATLVLASPASAPTPTEQLTANEAILGPNAPMMASR